MIIVLAIDNDRIPPLAIHGERMPAKRAGVRSDNAVNNPGESLNNCLVRPNSVVKTTPLAPLGKGAN